MRAKRWILLVLTALSLRAATTLAGAGATFPYPLYQKWIAAFSQKFPGATITYRAVGSGLGIEALRTGEADFAASDAPLSDRQMAELGKSVRHIPTVVGAVVPIYHLEGPARDLRFTPEILAGIYLGKIKRWDDACLRAVNRGVPLPADEIVAVHRSDGSGTTYIWTDYLSKVSAEWRSSFGAAADVRWPGGVPAAGNEGVAELVRKTPGSIGYVEFIYAVEGHLSYGAVRNAPGHFVQADLNSLPAAAAEFKAPQTGDLRASITNAGGPHAYPIASFTYFLVPEHFADAAKARLMAEFLRWSLTSGQKQSAALGYAALPEEVAKQALQTAGGFE
jgi:phosphate transport system substrate-binding protein